MVQKPKFLKIISKSYGLTVPSRPFFGAFYRFSLIFIFFFCVFYCLAGDFLEGNHRSEAQMLQNAMQMPCSTQWDVLEFMKLHIFSSVSLRENA